MKQKFSVSEQRVRQILAIVLVALLIGSAGYVVCQHTQKSDAFNPASNSVQAVAVHEGSVAFIGDTIHLRGMAELTPAPPTNGSITSVVKAEYYLSGRKLAETTVAPFRYVFDSTGERNGVYNLRVKLHDVSGAVATKTQKIIVANPVTAAYMTAQYGVGMGVSLLGLIAITLLLVGYVWPHFGRSPKSHNRRN